MGLEDAVSAAGALGDTRSTGPRSLPGRGVTPLMTINYDRSGLREAGLAASPTAGQVPGPQPPMFGRRFTACKWSLE
jgi:hypothetical protein